MKPPTMSTQREQPNSVSQRLVMYFLRTQLGRRNRPEQGATLIEALMTMVILSILVIAVSPPIILSVAARVRARQIELATQAAQNYIDSLSSGTLMPPMRNIYTTNPYFPTGTLTNFMPPTFLTVPNTAIDPGTAIDANGNGRFTDPQDFRIQAIRTIVNDPPETGISTDLANTQRQLKVQEVGYSLIVRVYRGDVSLNTAVGTREIKSIFTSNNGRGTGFRNNPLVEVRTNVKGQKSNLSGIKSQTACIWSTCP